LPDIGKIKEAEYAQGYYDGYEDGYKRAEIGLPYPRNLMTRRAREQAIEIYKKTRKIKGCYHS
jgi:flagellar biosynthesis/type III secretory pathway protein FliH